MANGVNKVILIGNLGKDPEVRTLDTGVKVATFTMATTENYTDREGQRQSQTEWHNIVLWRGLASVAEQYLRKGSKVYIEGKLTTRSYEKDGVTRYITEIVARDMNMLDSRSDAASGGNTDFMSGASAPAASSAANTSTPATKPVPPASSTVENKQTVSVDASEDEADDDLPF
ncbi:single-stranded DNA-binding protein [Algivirga pacifica]|uniref:Single-stranded DNA-binding protein n=1 Tax=Algivirga pacifica TaxID=1162670 RepID=A0ABP9D9M7_9BACT